MTCSKYYSHREPLFKQLDILKVTDLYKHSILKFCDKKEYSLESPFYFFQLS